MPADRPTASAAVGAVLASIGRTARPTTTARAGSLPVPVSAMRAVSPRSPESIAARRTSLERMTGCLGHGIRHDAFERAGADLAEQRAAQEGLLPRGRAGDEVAERRRTRAPSTGSGCRGQRSRVLVDLGRS